MISFNIMKYGLKSEFKDRISNNSKSYVIFNSESISKHATFKWEEKDKEFWLNGKLYDIVSTDNSGTIKCINDAQEKLLFQKLDQQINDFFSYNPINRIATPKELKNANLSATIPTTGMTKFKYIEIEAQKINKPEKITKSFFKNVFIIPIDNSGIEIMPIIP